MRFLPHSRGGVLWRALVGCIVVIGFAAGTTAVAGLLQIKTVVGDIDLSKPIKDDSDLQLPPAGSPQTLLLVGSDNRYGEGNTESNTDTMMLVRLNPKSSTINMLSIPRDLAVDIPGVGESKINAAWEDGGPNLLIQTLEDQVFPGLKIHRINHILNIDFVGFSDLIDAVGCVDAMVDHRYYNNTEQTDYSSIDIQPGYQPLCGGVYSPNGNGALAFVRFRHTDSDLVREMRQQDFLRWAKEGFSTDDLLNNQSTLLKIFGKHVSTDGNLHTTAGLLELFDLGVNAAGLQTKDIPFQDTFTKMIGQEDALGFNESESEALFQEFMTPTTSSTTTSTSTTTSPTTSSTSTSTKPAKSKPGKSKTTPSKSSGSANPIPSGLDLDPGDGLSQSAQLGKLSFPVYYPRYVVGGSEYCFAIGDSVTPSCYDSPNPITEYAGSYPRNYTIKTKDGKTYPAYVMTVVMNQALGEYYNVEGTTWKDPPILTDPADVVHVNGRTIDLYENTGGLYGDINLAAWHTGKAVYWIANTLDDAIPNDEMIAMAANLARGK